MSRQRPMLLHADARLEEGESDEARLPCCADIRTWHSNVEQHASEGVNKILIGNKCDWTDKKVSYHALCG